MSALADSNPRKRQYCYPQCRNPWFNECADCWQSGGNPAVGVRADELATPCQEPERSGLVDGLPDQNLRYRQEAT